MFVLPPIPNRPTDPDLITKSMSSKDKQVYYDSTTNSGVRPDLAYAVGLPYKDKIAIDCGCGAGSDITFLRQHDFTVHAFDIEEEAILRCKERFSEDSLVHLSKMSFNAFDYPKASLVVADASLFFCPPLDFESVWTKIRTALEPEGIFCGSFLGPKDTMAGSKKDNNSFWPDVMVCSEAEVRQHFDGFEILKWTEHLQSGKTADQKPHDWHIFSIVARSVA